MGKNNTKKRSIEGIATLHDKPVTNATVMITGDSPSHKDIAALTNDLGEYSFNDLITGEYTIMVNIEDQPPKTKKTKVVDDKTSKLNFNFE